MVGIFKKECGLRFIAVAENRAKAIYYLYKNSAYYHWYKNVNVYYENRGWERVYCIEEIKVV